MKRLVSLMLFALPTGALAQGAPPAGAAQETPTETPDAPLKPAPRSPKPAPPKPATQAAPDRPTAVVGALNKRTGRSQFFTLTPGQRAVFGPLAIFVATCQTSPPWEHPKRSGAFVQVDETLSPAQGQRTVRRVFSGWLFAESPSLNPVRHPVYDVWLRSCTMRFPDGPPAPSASPAQSRSNASKSPAPSTARANNAT